MTQDLTTVADFETIRQVNKEGNEFWYARDLQIILGRKLQVEIEHFLIPQ